MYLLDDQGNKFWRPTLKQERFLSIPLSVKEAFYAGAVNAGKSDVLLLYPLVHGWHKHSQFKGIFFRRTMPELRNEIIPRSRDYFRPFGATYNKTDACWTFPAEGQAGSGYANSGALFFMAHCENENDVHNYDSMQPNYAAFDELTSFTEWIYLYITIERVRVDQNLMGILPMICRSGSNPGNIGHNFVYKRFIKPYPTGGRILKGRGGIKRVFIPATIDDNPHASQQYKEELDALPDAEKKAKKYGDWTAYEGQVFDEFRDKHYPGEPENAVHMIAEFDIPSWWPRIVSIDWGFAAMCSIGFAAISPTKRVYVYRHLMFYGKKIEEWGPEVNFFVEKEQPADIIICHSANQHRGDPHSILEQVQEVLSAPVRLGEKDRIGGKLLLHEYLRWKIKPVPNKELGEYDDKLAQWLIRNKGLEEYNNYLKMFAPPEPEVNIPKLQFFDNEDVKVITESIKACVYEKSGSDGKKKEDVAEFAGDDPYDMIRMLLHSADQFFALAVDAQDRLVRTEQIVKQFQESRDWTSYYRNMKTLESQEMIKPLTRYHSGRTH